MVLHRLEPDVACVGSTAPVSGLIYGLGILERRDPFVTQRAKHSNRTRALRLMNTPSNSVSAVKHTLYIHLLSQALSPASSFQALDHRRLAVRLVQGFGAGLGRRRTIERSSALLKS